MADSAYISKADYKYMITTNRLDQILEATDEDEDAMLDSAETDAIAFIRNALANSYNMDIEFAKTGNDRNKVILKYAKWLVIYFIYERIPDEMRPDSVIKNYEYVLAQLKRMEDDKSFVVGLTPITVTDPLTGESKPKTTRRWGSIRKRTNDGGSPRNTDQ